MFIHVNSITRVLSFDTVLSYMISTYRILLVVRVAPHMRDVGAICHLDAIVYCVTLQYSMTQYIIVYHMLL